LVGDRIHSQFAANGFGELGHVHQQAPALIAGHPPQVPPPAEGAPAELDETVQKILRS
jgi:hypothetical protein